MLLTDELNALGIPDAEDLVAGTLMAPEQSVARANLIEQLSNEPNTRKAVRLLRELERFLARNV